MPRLTNQNPKYRKHIGSDGEKRARVTIAGRDFYLGAWKSKASKAEYDRLIGEYLANGRRLSAMGNDLTVGEVVDRFWDHAKTYYRKPDGTPTSELHTFKMALKPLNRLYGHTLAGDFGPLALEAIRNTMMSEGRRGWCRTHINKQLARIKMVFKWAVSKELVPASVHHALVTVTGLRAGRTDARESEPVRPVPDSVVDATLPHLSSVIGAIVKIQRLTGARPGEVCAMRTCDLDMGGDVWNYRPATHKTQHHGHQRNIPLGPKAQIVVRPFLKPLNSQAFIFSPRDAVAERVGRMSAERKTPLSCGNVPGSNRQRRPKRQPGESYDVNSLRRAIARACVAAGVSSWHPHQLRHSAATDIRRQFGIEAAQHVLGHASLKMTEIYAEQNADVAKRVAAAVG